MYDFGMTLKQIRTKRGLTQKQLANKIEVSEATISKYESNLVYPPFDKLRSLSTVLRVSLDELYGTTTRETISLYGLNAEQSVIVRDLIDLFRSHNDNSKTKPDDTAYSVLGRIVAEISK